MIPYQRKYRTPILNMLYYSRRTHVHLDWDLPGQWIEREGVRLLLAWDGGQLAGFMGVTPGLNGASWLRMIGVSNKHDTGAILALLWNEIQPILREDGIHQVALLAIHQWVEPYLPELGFAYQEDVITLYREKGSAMPELQKPVIIQPAYSEHMPQITRVDHAAFEPPWQMSTTDVYQARRYAAHYTIALVNQQIAGFQISTRHQGTGHLARLAVHPSMQGKGVGAALVYDLIDKLEKRGAESITVNTQMTNDHSQHLYERFGFRRNGFDFPVWAANIGAITNESSS